MQSHVRHFAMSDRDTVFLSRLRKVDVLVFKCLLNTCDRRSFVKCWLHVLATIILSHRHERLKGWLRIRIEFAKPVWGGRVCIRNPWSPGDTQRPTVTCFSLMTLDWRWSLRAAVCWLPLNFLLLETGVTWVILGPHGVIVRVRLMFWALTTNGKQVQHFFGNHVNNTRLIAMPKSCVIVALFFLLTQDIKHQKTINIMDLL